MTRQSTPPLATPAVDLAAVSEEYDRSVTKVATELADKAAKTGHAARAYKARISSSHLTVVRPPTK